MTTQALATADPTPTTPAALKVAEDSWRLVQQLFALGRPRSIRKFDPIAHSVLLALRGYAVMRSGLPGASDALARHYPRLYVQISYIQEAMAEDLSAGMDER